MMNKIVHTFVKKPSLLFLTDAIGAFATSFLLFVVVRNLDSYFSMPDNILQVLAAVAAAFFIYSGSCFLFLKKSWPGFIQIIIILNTLYCVSSLGILMLYSSSLTLLDIIYFLGEVVIIAALVVVELKTYRALLA